MTAVLWSGGVDSTTLLYNLALRNKANGVTKVPIKAISVIHPQVPCQSQQKNAREKLKHWFDAFDLNIELFEVNLISLAIADNFSAYDIVEGASIQPVIWLLGVIGFLKEDEDLHVGYVKGDDIWHKRAELTAIFDNAQKITSRVGKLKFELEWESKAEVIKAARDRGFLELCWWCEAIDYKKTTQCDKCKSCQTHKVGLYQLGLIEEQEHKALYETKSIGVCPDRVCSEPDKAEVKWNPGELHLGPHNLVPSTKNGGSADTDDCEKEVA